MQRLALIMLAACAAEPAFDGPAFPATLHLADGLPAPDEDTWIAAGERWAKALGVPTFDRVARGGSGCGVYAVDSGGLSDSELGKSGLLADCKAYVMMRATLAGDMRVYNAAHELGHLLRGDGWHNPDPRSVMHSPSGSEILAEDLPSQQ